MGKVKEKSVEMNKILNRKLREFAMDLRSEYYQNASDKNIVSKLQKMKKKQMNQIYKLLVICFGEIRTTFDWKYTDKELGFRCIYSLSPLDFYQKYVKVGYDLNELVSLVHDPRNGYFKLLEVAHYGNVIGGRRQTVQYLNVPMSVLKEQCIAMMRDEKTCWFACDVRCFYFAEFGSLDEGQFDFEALFGGGIGANGMTKREYLEYGASCNSHSMVFCGFDEDENGKVRRWKVENSWSEKKGNKGFVTMTDEWFDRFVYQVLVQKDKLSTQIIDILQTEPTILPRWDPFAQ